VGRGAGGFVTRIPRYVGDTWTPCLQKTIKLRRIKHCAVAIFVCHVLVLPLFYLYAQADDAPGVVIVGCVVPFASVVIAVFAAVLQKLLRHAIDIKTENELTI